MSDFEVNYRYLSKEGKRNLTVKHRPTGIKITSPDYHQEEISDKELKSKVWEVMKMAIEIFEKNE